MQIKNCSIDSLIPYVNNARTHSPEQIALIASSIKEFGFNEPIAIDGSKGIIAGHGRLMAARLIGLSEVPTIELSHLTRTQQKAYLLAHNKLAERAGWDSGLLLSELDLLKDEGFNLDLTGFDSHEIEDMRPEVIVDGLCDEDEIPSAAGECRTAPGDIWRLGDHLLMCGDSTNSTDVERLMETNKAQICFTSPPYNLGVNSRMRGTNADGKESAYIEKSDHKTQQEYLNFLYGFTNTAILFCDILFVNIQLLAGNKTVFPEFLYQYRENLVDVILWDKVNAQPAMPRKVLNSAFEFIVILSKEHLPKRTIETAPDFRGTVSNIYRLDPVHLKEDIQKDHGAVFPVKFAEDHIKQFSTGSVYEPFCGTGTTLIACEKLGRKSFNMELSPQYCDLTLARWEKFTGKQAGCVSD